MSNVVTAATVIQFPGDPVAEGRDAWTRIKGRAKMDREDWRKVGEALLYGRRLHASDKLFGQWCRDQGFDDLDRSSRADAIWLAENWSTVGGSYSSDISHPHLIRAAYRELQAGASQQGSASMVTVSCSPSSDSVGSPQVASPAPPFPDTPSNAVDATDEESGPVGIFNNGQTKHDSVRQEIGKLVSLRADKSGESFFRTFMEAGHPDYFLEKGIRAFYNEMRAHAGVEDAIAAAEAAIRQAEAEMLEQVTNKLVAMGSDALAEFRSQIKKNPVLSSPNPLTSKLLTRAMDESSEPEERMKAISVLRDSK